MAQVKTFRVQPSGVPDKEIREWLNRCEERELINVQMVFIPPLGDFDARITVIATKLDDHGNELAEENYD